MMGAVERRGHHTPVQLPAQPTPLIGREALLRTGQELLLRDDVRLLTLTGTAGTGKTRLAVHLAQGMLARGVPDAFPDGVCFVDLAPLTGAAQVLDAVAQAVDLRETEERPLRDRLQEALRRQRRLLVLDNFEHVLPAAVDVADLLANSTALKVLVTSRVPLHVRWEHEFPVPPLALPDLGHLPSYDELLRTPALALFLDRARATRPDFAVEETEARALAELCVHLDGLPLAIELAAARVKVFPVAGLLAHLRTTAGLLQFLSGGPQDLPARQQTLRAAIAWSYDLLSADEQRLFRRLGVFAGGWTVEAAEAVAASGAAAPKLTSAAETLETLISLVDKSLLREAVEVRSAGADTNGETDETHVRFSMLETIREYALARLDEAGEAAVARAAHAAYFLRLAEEAAPHLLSAGRGVWLRRLEGEHDNIRAALVFCLGQGNALTGLRLAAALWWFWYFAGHLSEGRRWLAAALAADFPDPDGGAAASAGAPRELARCRALCGAGTLAFYQGDYQAAPALLGQAVALARETGDTGAAAHALTFLGLATQDQGDTAAAQTLLEEAVALARQHGHRWQLALTLSFAARPLRHLHRLEEAQRSLDESVAVFRATGDPWGTALALNSLGNLALQRGDYETGRRHYEPALALRRQIGDRWFIAHSLTSLGEVARHEGHLGEAQRLLAEAAELFSDLYSPRMLAVCLAELAQLAAAMGELRRAARLAAAVQAMCDAVGAVLDPTDAEAYEASLANVRAELDAEAFASEWAAGRALSIDEVVALVGRDGGVQGEIDAGSSAAAGVAHNGTGGALASLTPREREVAALLAEGLTNRQIASRLVITEQTAETHVKRILSKLSVSTRTEAAARVLTAGLTVTPA
jgi:predicted ATPase/DNA-binding NarL/FixJ family response regulator